MSQRRRSRSPQTYSPTVAPAKRSRTPSPTPANLDGYIYAGPASSYPDISTSASTLTPADAVPPLCQVLATTPRARRLSVSEIQGSRDLSGQVLVFRYRGKFHAVDHRCPHSSYALSQGVVHDIEDFGIVLSAGIRCPRHGWDFDLFTGEGDRGAYRLGLWDVKVVAGEKGEEGVWVRRRGRDVPRRG